MKTLRNPRWQLLLLGPVLLLLGAHGTGERRFALGQLPACGPDQYLTLSKGALACRSLPSASRYGVPDCTGQLLSNNGAFYPDVWHCTDKGPAALGAADQAALFAAEASVQQSTAALDAIQQVFPSTFVGLTKKSTAGRFTHPGADPGLAAAKALCADDFPGAHMCTPYEMYDTVRAGKLNMANTVAKSWIFFPTWKHPDPTAKNPLEGLADNCASYTYAGTDSGWAGTAVEWTFLVTGTAGFKLHGGPNAPCSQPLPIACCR